MTYTPMQIVETVSLGGKDTEIQFNAAMLAEFERLLGRSILMTLQDAGTGHGFGIDFVLCGITAGLRAARGNRAPSRDSVASQMDTRIEALTANYTAITSGVMKAFGIEAPAEQAEPSDEPGKAPASE